MFDDGADDAQQRDDEEQATDNDEDDRSDTQKVRVGRVRRHGRYVLDVRRDKHPDTNRHQQQSAQLTKTFAYVETSNEHGSFRAF